MNKDRLFVLMQYCLPKIWLTRFFGFLAERHIPGFSPLIIRLFARHYEVDMRLAEQENLSQYRTFNAFFTRALKADARPNQCGDKDIMCPVDGAISQLGKINGQGIFQAKGHEFNLSELLGNYQDAALPFENGHFCTIYLSPKDYHRIHMPRSGQLQQMIHIPGKLFSVNPATVAGIENLFAINERVVALFDTDIGPMAVVFVGATIVGSIETVWSGTVTPPSSDTAHRWHYDAGDAPYFEQGAEIGRFKLGSTVIVLFGENAIHWSKQWSATNSVIMGEVMATCQGSDVVPEV